MPHFLLGSNIRPESCVVLLLDLPALCWLQFVARSRIYPLCSIYRCLHLSWSGSKVHLVSQRLWDFWKDSLVKLLAFMDLERDLLEFSALVLWLYWRQSNFLTPWSIYSLLQLWFLITFASGGLTSKSKDTHISKRPKVYQIKELIMSIMI